MVLQFETYDEAVATARGAVTVLAGQAHAPADEHDLPDVSDGTKTPPEVASL